MVYFLKFTSQQPNLIVTLVSNTMEFLSLFNANFVKPAFRAWYISSQITVVRISILYCFERAKSFITHAETVHTIDTETGEKQQLFFCSLGNGWPYSFSSYWLGQFSLTRSQDTPDLHHRLTHTWARPFHYFTKSLWHYCLWNNYMMWFALFILVRKVARIAFLSV